MSTCTSPFVLPMTGRSLTLFNVSDLDFAVFRSFSSNSAGQSSLSGPLVCAQTAMLPDGLNLPTWSCSRSAAPSQPAINISDVTAAGFELHWSDSKAGSASSVGSYVVQIDDWWDHQAGHMADLARLPGDAHQYSVSERILAGAPYNVR